MYTSTRWLNDYLDPPATAEEQAELATRAGFPLEDTEVVEGDDVRQDYEMTSNRGDCVCHVGLAREIAAISGRKLLMPEVLLSPSGPPAADLVRVINQEHEGCPLYTARVIRGVKVGPSPDWLQARLKARGDIPRNNVVDATNFVLFELGQPTHVFDMAKLKGGEINIRMARPDEPFLPIGEGEEEVKLTADDLVIADAEDAVALAGVKGGALSAVTDSTTDILLEAATFHPVWVRNTSRRHTISSDSCYRFERGVHPAAVNAAADRLAQLILEIAGGELCDGIVADGAPLPSPRQVDMRLDRCRKLLGVPIEDDEIVESLARLGFEPQSDGDRVHCTVPVFRLDIEREIDLVEEVGRMYGHDRIPITESVQVRVAPPQPQVLAKRAVHDTLVGMSFVECVTHSLISETAASPFLAPGAEFVMVDDERAGEPVLRPSNLPCLLRVRAHNLHNGVRHLKLFESGSIFWQDGSGQKHERSVIAMTADEEVTSDGLRPIRGAIERLACLLLGDQAEVEFVAGADKPWFKPGAHVKINGEAFGYAGLIDPAILRQFDIEDPVLGAELELPRLYGTYPPDTVARALPVFPAIERDISAVVAETVAWDDIRRVVLSLDLEFLETVEFVTTFRGQQIGAGHKSLTFRCRFRAPDRTLKHEEVDPQMDRVMSTIESNVSAEIRK